MKRTLIFAAILVANTACAGELPEGWTIQIIPSPTPALENMHRERIVALQSEIAEVEARLVEIDRILKGLRAAKRRGILEPEMRTPAGNI